MCVHALPLYINLYIFVCIFILYVLYTCTFIFIYMYIYIYANMQPLTDSRADDSTCYISRRHLEPPHLPGDRTTARRKWNPPRYGHPLGLEDSMLP